MLDRQHMECRNTYIRRASGSDSVVIHDCVIAAYGKYISEIGIVPKPMSLDYESEIANKDTFVACNDVEIFGFILALLVKIKY